MQHIKICLVIAISCLLTACSINKEEMLTQNEVVSFCREIINVSSGNSDIGVDSLTQGCNNDLKNEHVVAVTYDKLDMSVDYLYDQSLKSYVCICSCEFGFDDTDNIWEHVYRIIFNYDSVSNTVLEAEVIDYEEYQN